MCRVYYGELCGLLGGATLLAVWRQSGELNTLCQESNKYIYYEKKVGISHSKIKNVYNIYVMSKGLKQLVPFSGF